MQGSGGELQCGALRFGVKSGAYRGRFTSPAAKTDASIASLDTRSERSPLGGGSEETALAIARKKNSQGHQRTTGQTGATKSQRDESKKAGNLGLIFVQHRLGVIKILPVCRTDASVRTIKIGGSLQNEATLPPRSPPGSINERH